MAKDLTANLARAHRALGELIAAKLGADSEHEWAAFYDALQFVPGVEDAAADALLDTLADMGLDGEGYPAGDLWDESIGDREFVPMTAIRMPQVSA